MGKWGRNWRWRWQWSGWLAGKQTLDTRNHHHHSFRGSPYGAAGLLATYDADDGPALALVEPSGVAHRYHGAAVGKARQAVRNELEKMKLGQLTCREAVAEAAKM